MPAPDDEAGCRQQVWHTKEKAAQIDGAKEIILLRFIKSGDSLVKGNFR